MLIQERLQLILKMHNLTPSAFADQIGVQRSNVSHVLSGRNKPSLDFLEKIITTYTRVNAHWLITGQNPSQELQIKNDSKVDNERIEQNQEKASIYNSSGLIVKVVEFYSNGTFKEYFPSSK